MESVISIIGLYDMFFNINSFTILTKNDCSWCDKAKKLLKSRNIIFKELEIPYSLSRNEFYDIAEKYNTTKTVPKIFNGKELIGGYEDLQEYIENGLGGFGEGSL